MAKTKLEWLTKSPTMYSYSNGNTNMHLKGGRLYEMEVLETLKDQYDISLNEEFVKRESSLGYFFKTHKRLIKGDICFVDPYVLAFGKFSTSKKNIAIIHHVDEDIREKKIFGNLFINRIIRNLKKMDKVIVVSKFWADYLREKGIENIEIIYNSFTIEDYHFIDEEKRNFKKRYKMPLDKPLIYIGQNGNGKGIEKILNVIDTSKYHVVLTGKKKHESDELETYYFEKDEFPLFIASCDIVITMSTMIEGWNRTAHEAILAGIPVIGPGSGGMCELLTDSHQVILKDINDLNKKIEKCLLTNSANSDKTKNYIKQFNKAYFESSWKRVIAEL